MLSVRIAAAQSTSLAGDLASNVKTHCRFIAAAAHAGVELLVFPELSLSGYELPILGSCKVAPEAQILVPLKALAVESNMTVVVGCPLANASGKPHIGSIIFSPDGSTATYRKQHLHKGEEAFAAPYVVPAQRYLMEKCSFALAICADTANAMHAEAAAATGAQLYLASVLVSEAGYEVDSGNLQRYARQHGVGVLMANHGGLSGGYFSAGKSAFWKPDGELLVESPGTGSYLVTATCRGDVWSGDCFAVNVQ